MTMNNGPQVLTGRNPQTQTLMGNQQNGNLGGQPQQPQMQQNNNPLAQLAGFSAKIAGQVNNPNSQTSLYSTVTSRNNYAHLLCLEDNAAEEQMKAQALADAGNLATNIFNICARRIVQNPFYRVHCAAKERFKSPRKNLPPDQTLSAFIDEIDSNQILYQFILANVSIMFTAEFANAIMRGDERVRTDRAVVDDMYYRCTIDAIYMQYFDFLAQHPDGSQIYYNAAPVVKEVLNDLEPKLYDMVLSKFTFVNVQCPWRKGRLGELQQRSTQSNPLLDNSNIMDMGFAGTYYDPNYNPNMAGLAGQTNDAGLRELQEYVRQKAAGYTPKPQQPAEENRILQTTYGGYDQPELKLEDMTRENRLRYSLDKWGSQIPGTEWWVMREKDVVHFARVMDMDDGIPFRVRDTRCVGTVPVYRFNWQNGTFNFRLVKHKLQAFDIMGTLISNPDKLLPYMYEEDGVQKTTFDPTILETSKFVNEGHVIPVGEMKELEKEPDILIGNKPMKANQGNEHILNRMDVITQTYDPKNKLDAFVMPMVITREWQMDSHVNMDRFYSQFRVMVQGNTAGMDDTIQVLRSIRAAYNECEDQEFKDFIKPYITNLVNRYLIEVRGYAETKQESIDSGVICYLKSSDIFEDLEDWIECLKNDDLPTLRAFADYRFNTFMRMGIEVLCGPEQVKEEYQEKYGKDDDEIFVAAMLKSAEKAVIIKRNTVFFNLRKQPAPHTVEAITIKESVNPELFAIIREATRITAKHFKDTPQILVRFETDSGNKVFTVTPSGFDPESVVTLRPVDAGQTYCHPYPIVD